MKRILLIAGVVSLLSAAAFAAERSVLARVTVYWASGGSGSDKWTRKHIAASGARLRSGHCAVDPRRIPYGSKVTFPDGTLTAVDTGGSVRRRTAARKAGRTSEQRGAIVIDRFFETKAQALAWAKRNPHFMTVRVSAPNESLAETATTTTSTTKTVQKRTDSGALVKSIASRSTTTKTTTSKLVTQASQPSTPRVVASMASTSTTRRVTTAAPSRTSMSAPPATPRIASNTPAASTAAVVTTPPPQPPPLRNSISTPRTQPTLTVTTAGRAPALTVVPTGSPAPANANRVTTALNSAPKIAANTPAQTTSPAADENRSHYGRSVSYVP